ncbi:MAG: glycosyltransferase, partial [Candidatus Marinimicrobia bacterium]|nr:glycosyltransferase [Candidatus Neomarinimicrobiota bacterium]
VVSERGRQLANLTEIVSERDRQVAGLTKKVSELAALAQVVSNRDEQVDYLNQLLTERHEQIAGLTSAVAAGEEQRGQLEKKIEGTNDLLAEKDDQYMALQERFLQVTFSLPWMVVSKTSSIFMKVPGLSSIADRVRTAVDARRMNKTKDLIAGSGLFDIEFYLEAYPDIKEEGFEPISHFVRYGVFEGRRPNAAFDPEFYRKSYLDVGISGLNPLLHYILFGRDMGYLTQDNACQVMEAPVKNSYPVVSVTDSQFPLNFFSLLPDIDISGCFDSMDTARETVMVVSHEGSRTGEPILSYNLVKKLLGKYNVVALFLGPGPMAEACYREGAVSIVSSKEYCRQPEMAEKLIDAVTATVNLKFALVNSIESRGVLGPLGNAYIPTLCLIHEFAVYTRPVDAFRETVLWSGTVVFSSRVTYNNMVSEYPYLGDQKYEILPQGRCEVPAGNIENKEEAGADPVPESAVDILRPAGFPADGIVVLGAGFVQIRKGVDLFISCAAKVTARFPEIPFRFVWVGKGYDPVHNMNYSVYLADQVARAGLEDHVFFMNEVDDIEAVYAQADILLLSSRLDPLPNVAIDAFFNELPVVCFSETTGMAEVLEDFGLRDFCVADYLDIDDMASKVGRLAQSAKLRGEVAEKAEKQALEIFNMDRYVEQLEHVARQAENRARQEREDVETIVEAGFFDIDYYAPPGLESKEFEEIIRYYVRSWVSGVLPRKLYPGFHPGIYHEQHGTAVVDGDPLADYIR